MAKKIPVSTNQSPLQQSPFSGLAMSGLPEGAITPPPTPEPSKTKSHRIVLRREKAQRGDKTVVVVSQLPTHLSPPEIENLSREARKALGCGGSVQNREIELQGDHPDRVRSFFEKKGYTVGGV